MFTVQWIRENKERFVNHVQNIVSGEYGIYFSNVSIGDGNELDVIFSFDSGNATMDMVYMVAVACFFEGLKASGLAIGIDMDEEKYNVQITI